MSSKPIFGVFTREYGDMEVVCDVCDHGYMDTDELTELIEREKASTQYTFEEGKHLLYHRIKVEHAEHLCEVTEWRHFFDESSRLGDYYLCGVCDELMQVG